MWSWEPTHFMALDFALGPDILHPLWWREPQDHVDWRGPSSVSCSEHVQLEKVAQDFIQLSFEYLQKIQEPLSAHVLGFY